MLLNTNLKIVVRPYNDNYFMTVTTEDGYKIPISEWKHLLFSRHGTSFYGLLVTEIELENINGVEIDGWQLVTLFANEQFNEFINWDWCEYAETCLAAAAIVEEAILAQDWLPDFQGLKEGKFSWALPERVVSEFLPPFWEQIIDPIEEDERLALPKGQHDQPTIFAIDEKSPFDDGDNELNINEQAKVTALQFVTGLFNRALMSYFEQTDETEQVNKLQEKIATLLNSGLDLAKLANYFDEESWASWIGLGATELPFSLGVQLTEPEDGVGDWSLTPFLRLKQSPDDIINYDGGTTPPSELASFQSDIETQIEQWRHIVPFLKNKTMPFLLSEQEAWSFLMEGSEVLLALGIEIMLPSWWQAIQEAQLQVRARVRDSDVGHRPAFVGIDALLNFDWRFSLNGVDFSEEEFLELVEEKRRLIYVQGRWVSLDPELISQIQGLIETAKERGLHVRDLLEQQLGANSSDVARDDDDGANDAEELSQVQFELSQQWRQMVQQLTSLSELPSFPVSDRLQGELRPYQKLGMDWLLFLRQFGFGACLADDMGLGKTIQLIAYLLAAQDSGAKKPNLIVCPTSVLGNWQKELERFAPDLQVYLHYGQRRLKDEEFADEVAKADVVLTSYALVNNDLEQLTEIEWGAIAIDEAQNIKNSATKQSRAVRSLRGEHHIALTGTPMENRLSELWSIFDFINRGYLGSLSQFQQRFIIPIERDNDAGEIDNLRSLIRPFLLRRTKQDEEVALNLPDKLEQKEYCPLTAEQAAFYEQLVTDTFAQLEKLTGFQRKGIILQMLSKLKQLCNHPALYLKEKEPQNLVNRSTKLQKLVELVEVILDQRESCLVFTQYIRMGHFIQDVLKEQFGIEVPFLNGSVPKQKRDEMISSFQNGEFPVLLLSLKAGGTGLNLTAANHVVHYDRWWNPAVENQATDRAYRIGQKRFVHVHKLICTGTLEEKIDEMIEKKQALNDEIIQSDSWITELDQSELHELITLG